MPGRQQHRDFAEPNIARRQTNIAGTHKIDAQIRPLAPPAAIPSRLNVHNPRPADPG